MDQERLCNNNTLAEFWWEKGTNKKEKHWLAWKRLCIPKRDGGIGFRDIEEFNLALLGKQAWRIFQNPQSLAAKVLKGRYFPHTNILNAKRGKQAYYVWNSILACRDLLIKGLRFIVGDGKMINAWIDPWLPTTPPRAARPVNQDIVSMTVHDLMQDNSIDWDIRKLNNLIHPEDVDIIRNIKLYPEARDDYLGWHYSHHGQYTVKSAYWVATHHPTYEEPFPPSGNPDIKAKIWKLQLPSKIKHFLWRIITDIIPSGENLCRRHITDSVRCPHCDNVSESTNHILFCCPYARTVWQAANMNIPGLCEEEVPLEDKIEALLNLKVMKLRSLLILWRVWKARNLLLYQTKSITATTTLTLALKDEEELTPIPSTMEQDSNLQRVNGITPTARWKPPLRNEIKCNYDCAFKKHCPTGNGWVIRDSMGNFIKCGYAKGQPTASPLEGEIQALLMALKNIWGLGFNRIVMEGDNQTIPKLLDGEQQNFATFNWIRNIKWWEQRFESIRYVWTPRKNNMPAHILAQLGIRSHLDCFFYNNVPNILRSSLRGDR